MKRKDCENAFDDDFPCFSLSASARKSRRLDCELAPIIEEEYGSGVSMVPDEDFLHESSSGRAALVSDEAVPVGPVVAPNDPLSEELAIVLYNPQNAGCHGMVKSPSSSNLSLVMNPELLSGWKSHMLHQGLQSRLTITELDEESDEYKSFQFNNSMAVVPWVASQAHPFVTVTDSEAPLMSEEPMQADGDCEMMEFDDNSTAPDYNNQGYNTMNIGMMGSEFQTQPALPLQQPHCALPQYAPNTPIRW